MAEGYIEYDIVYRGFRSDHTRLVKVQMRERASEIPGLVQWLPVGKSEWRGIMERFTCSHKNI